MRKANVLKPFIADLGRTKWRLELSRNTVGYMYELQWRDFRTFQGVEELEGGGEDLIRLKSSKFKNLASGLLVSRCTQAQTPSGCPPSTSLQWQTLATTSQV